MHALLYCKIMVESRHTVHRCKVKHKTCENPDSIYHIYLLTKREWGYKAPGNTLSCCLMVCATYATIVLQVQTRAGTS